ncbi:DUF898 domain-containing protein [Thalassotalea sp. M1531]|uniref:DUF898 domain-containing protein n=1 Tax=Thalassotalea algicola TaxID=2716224 RepID=A0A7Y0Q7H3_9GAMM|nr:YjgN family protein [Thalassotalea algicola]NMP31892.1 DUF898 domain-containing protein [Thalassotalea algicola]
MEPLSNQNSATQVAPQQVGFKFHGRTGEFFGIWIVNVLLSILTLGIYSAWAKVRTNRYFYGNTELDGHRFSYLATPLQILKGRIIAVVLFGAYYLVTSMFPVAGVILSIAMIFLFPFLICSSLRFNLRMSSYRNVRFNFTGRYGQALLNLFILPIVSVFTLYLLMPWTLKRIDNFLVSNTQYGNKTFEPSLSTGKYYGAAIATVLLGIIALVLVALVTGMLGVNLLATGEEANVAPEFTFSMLGIMAVYLVAFSFVGALYQSMIRNHIFENTELTKVAKFGSSFEFTSLAILNVTNLAALICTFGLAYPWTRIRKARYVVNNTQVFASPDKEQVIDNIGEGESAIGDEVANAFDVDIALT